MQHLEVLPSALSETGRRSPLNDEFILAGGWASNCSLSGSMPITNARCMIHWRPLLTSTAVMRPTEGIIVVSWGVSFLRVAVATLPGSVVPLWGVILETEPEWGCNWVVAGGLEDALGFLHEVTGTVSFSTREGLEDLVLPGLLLWPRPCWGRSDFLSSASIVAGASNLTGIVVSEV